MKVLDGVQVTLDLAGFAPGVGFAPDLINALISAGRGNHGEAMLSLAAAIPFWGDGFKAGKMLAKAAKEGAQHVDEVGSIVSGAVRHFGDEAVSSIPESRRIVGKNWLDEVRKKVKIEFVENLGSTAQYDALTLVIQVNAAKWFKMNNAQRVTVIYHELWHYKEGLTRVFPRFGDFLYKETALGRFFSEGMAQFYGSKKVFASISKGFESLAEGEFRTSELVIELFGVVSAEVGIFWGTWKFFEEE